MPNDTAISLLDFTLAELRDWLTRQGHPPFRAAQIFQWIYQKGASSFAEMSNLPETMRNELARLCTIDTLPVIARREDPRDQTWKYLFQLPDGESVEAVLMPRYAGSVRTDPASGEVRDSGSGAVEGYTVCLTTQVGCLFACRFCASGQLGWKRNLRAGEIIAQVLGFIRAGRPVSRVVFMGTGEPLHNLDAVRQAVAILHEMHGLNLSPRRITLSTVGLVPEMYRIAQEGWKVKLALSLHATSDVKRAALMPLARAYELDQVKDAARYYYRRNGRRISLEYLMIQDVNDSPKDAERLAKFCADLECHVNLIPYNFIPHAPFRPSSPERIQDFKAHLLRHKIDATVRYSRGRSIDAACGQLRLRHEQARTA
ncbi:MAG: 23S rRNA (adenine(2503)-C(2))-methyltransferase RlmN [bacterium]